MKLTFGKERKETVAVDNRSVSSTLDDDKLLEDIGYVPSFKREFSNLATVSRFCLCSTIIIDIPRIASPDQFRVQYHGALLVGRDDLQYPTTSRRPCICDVVLDPGRVHVLYPWCVAT